MKILYKSELRNQLLEYGTIDNELKETLLETFNKEKNYFLNRKLSWFEWFDNILYPQENKNRFFISAQLRYRNIIAGEKYDNLFFKNIISMSLKNIYSII